MQNEEDHQLLQNLEGRLSVVENWKEEMSVEMVNRLVSQITDRLNKNLVMYLPKVGKMI